MLRQTFEAAMEWVRSLGSGLRNVSATPQSGIAVLEARRCAWRATSGTAMLLVLWLSLMLAMATHHAFWRDEVRALSLATEGANVIEMLRSLHGEGHPALWYLMLRVGYSVLRNSVILEILAGCIGTATVLLILYSSPFPMWLRAVFLLNGVLLFEFSVMARNYGISACLVFGFAALYYRCREKGAWLGVILLLLANTNVHSCILAGCFVAFWLIDILTAQGFRWTPALRSWALNACVAALGAVLCFATVYPPAHDAAALSLGELTFHSVAAAILVPASSFRPLMVWGPFNALQIQPVPAYEAATAFKLLSALMFGSTIGLVRRPGAMLASVGSMLLLSLFFVCVYPSFYRHSALWFTFMISLYWITWNRQAKEGLLLRTARAFGLACLVAIAVLQLPVGVQAFADVVLNRPPASPVRELGAFLRSRPDLRDAVLMSEPNFLIEALPAYASNMIYMFRDRRFEPFTSFNRGASPDVDLQNILDRAQELQSETGVPVLVAIQKPLDPAQPEQRWHEGFGWYFVVRPEQVRHFLACTTRVAEFPVSSAVKYNPDRVDESFDLYMTRRCS